VGKEGVRGENRKDVSEEDWVRVTRRQKAGEESSLIKKGTKDGSEAD